MKSTPNIDNYMAEGVEVFGAIVIGAVVVVAFTLLSPILLLAWGIGYIKVRWFS